MDDATKVNHIDVEAAPSHVLPSKPVDVLNFAPDKEQLKSNIHQEHFLTKLKERISSPSHLPYILFVICGYAILKNRSSAEHPAFIHSNPTDLDNLSTISKARKVIELFLKEKYWPNIFCMNRDMSTLLGYVRRGPSLQTRRELIPTGDGGKVALDWTVYDSSINGSSWTGTTPTMLLIHGLNGHSEEAYIKYCMHLAHQKGWRSVGFNHRGCGGTKLYSPLGYSGAYTGDIRAAVKHIKKRWPDSPLYAAGFSLGANLLVKYLGEEREHSAILGAVSVSNPWDFYNNSEVSEGRSLRSLVYSLALTHELKQYVRTHRAMLEHVKGLDIDDILRSATIADFDQRATVPLWGYKDWKEYQIDGSSCLSIPDVRVPLLAINALDDPVVSATTIPYKQIQSNPHTFLVTTQHGGHIGWGEGKNNPVINASWAERFTVTFLTELHTSSMSSEKNEKQKLGSKGMVDHGDTLPFSKL